jgi:cell division protein FtsB
MQRALLIVLLLLLILVQYRLWIGDNSLAERERLRQEIAQQQLEIERLQARNEVVAREVEALKDGLEEIEARAREELGLIKDGETFYLILDEQDTEAEGAP